METNSGGFCVLNSPTNSPCPGAFSKSATLGPNFAVLLARGPFPLATKNLTSTGGGAFTRPNLGVFPFGTIKYPVNGDRTGSGSEPIRLDQNKGPIKVDHK